MRGIKQLAKTRSYTGPGPELLNEYVNFHAFAANLFDRHIFCSDPSWAIWAQREAHEDGGKGYIHDVNVLAAAQWILWYGQSFFKHLLFPGDVSADDLRKWRPGPLYKGKAHLTLHRWHFWRDGFNAVASEGMADEKGLRRECEIVAGKAAEMMDSLERNMTFGSF